MFDYVGYKWYQSGPSSDLGVLIMAEGTRMKCLDDRLGALENKFSEFSTAVGRDKDVRTKQLGEMNKTLEGLGSQVAQIGSNFDEVKALMVSLHKQGRSPEPHRPPFTCLLYTSPSPRDRG